MYGISSGRRLSEKSFMIKQLKEYNTVGEFDPGPAEEPTENFKAILHPRQVSHLKTSFLQVANKDKLTPGLAIDMEQFHRLLQLYGIDHPFLTDRLVTRMA